MQTRTVKYAIGALLGLALLACTRGGGEAFEEQAFSSGKTRLHIGLSLAGEARSKTANPDTPEVEGVDWENAVRTLSVFVRNEYNGEWAWDTLFRLYDVQEGRDYEVTLDKPLTTETRLYAAANLSRAQEEALKRQVEDEGAYYALPENDFRVVEAFAPYSTWEAGEAAGRGDVAMCCTEAVHPTGGEDNRFAVSFDLKRLVAKVLVTVEEAAVEGGEEGVAYALVVSDENSNFKGWIRRENIRYVLDGLNRKAYIRQRIDGKEPDTDANVIDPNPDLHAFPTEESTEEDFYSFPVGGAGREGGYAEALAFEQESYVRVLAFDEGRLEGNGHYYEGIYCPENTFEPVDSFEEGQWMMITHVVISAEFTPQVLQVEYGLFDYIAGRIGVSEEQKEIVAALKESIDESGGTHEETDVVGVTCPTEETARLLLTESLRRGERLLNMDNSHKDVERFFEEASYFYYDEQYHTYGAAMCGLGIDYGEGLKLNDLEAFGNYVPYNGGRGYYYTYIDNRNGDRKAGEPFAFYRHGQVERNRYYILTITGFSKQGASFTNPNYIEVHTRKLDWQPGGSGNVSLGEGTNIERRQE